MSRPPRRYPLGCEATTRALLPSIALGSLGIAPQVELSWQAPESCPGAEVVRGRIDALTTQHASGLVASVIVTERAGGYVAEVALERDGARSTRELSGATCDVLADAVAVVVAIESDGVAVIPEPASAATPPDGHTPPALPELRPGAPERGPEPRASAPSPRSKPARPRLAIRGGGGLEGRGAPGLTGVVEIGAGLRWRRWYLDVGILHAFARTRRLKPPDAGIGARVGLWSAAIGGAFVPSVGIVGFPLSVRLELGDAIGSGFGDASARRVHALWVVGRLGAGLSIALGERIALWVDPSLGVAWVRPRFAVRRPQGDATVAQAAWIGLRALAGVEVRFW